MDWKEFNKKYNIDHLVEVMSNTYVDGPLYVYDRKTKLTTRRDNPYEEVYYNTKSELTLAIEAMKNPDPAAKDACKEHFYNFLNGMKEVEKDESFRIKEKINGEERYVTGEAFFRECKALAEIAPETFLEDIQGVSSQEEAIKEDADSVQPEEKDSEPEKTKVEEPKPEIEEPKIEEAEPEEVKAEELNVEEISADTYANNQDLKELNKALSESGIPVDLESAAGVTAFYEINNEGIPVPVYDSPEDYIKNPGKLERVAEFGTLTVLDVYRYSTDEQAYPRIIRKEDGKFSVGESIDKVKDERIRECANKLTNPPEKDDLSLEKAYDKFYQEMADHNLDYEKIRENNYRKVLKNAGVKIDDNGLLNLRRNGGKFYMRGENAGTLQAVEIDSKTKRIKIGEPVAKPTAAPKKPNFFKRLLHGINKNLFKEEFDRYHKAKDTYEEVKFAFEWVEGQEENERIAAQKAEEAREKEKAEVAEKAAKTETLTEALTEALKSDETRPEVELDNNAESYRKQVLSREGKTKVEDLSLADRLDIAVQKEHWACATAVNDLYVSRDFCMHAGGEIHEIKEDLDANKPFDVEKARACMAHICLVDMLSRGCKINKIKFQPLAKLAAEQYQNEWSNGKMVGTRLLMKPIPMVQKIMDSPAFQKYTENLTPDKLASFVNDNEFVKLNHAMAKEKQVKQNTNDVQKQKNLQNQKQNDAPKLQGP